MKSANNRGNPPRNMPITKRRLKTKPALTLMGILLAGNLFWFILWLLPSSKDSIDKDEIVATIDDEKVTRQQWLASMESRFGKETLQNIVNGTVMEKAAEQHKIKVTDDEIKLEIALIRSTQDQTDTAIQNLTDQQLHEKVKSQLILEKVLAKDIIVEDEAVEEFYEANQALYNIPTAYRTNIIMTDTKEDADSVLKELKNGSEFTVLAKERSVDTPSASLGGEIGFITAKQENIDGAITQEVSKLKASEVSDPFVLSDGRYAIVQVVEVVEGKSFTYDNVKDHINRTLAMEQLPSTITPENFWTEFNVTWFYGESK